MQLTVNDVRRIARLARIAVTEAEAELALIQLRGIFTLIEQMQSVDTEGVEPMAHAGEVTLRLREDRVTESDRRAALQAVAPAVADGLYLVPKVIE